MLLCVGCRAKNHQYRERCVLCGGARAETRKVVTIAKPERGPGSGVRGGGDFITAKHAFSKPPFYVRSWPDFARWRRRRAWMMASDRDGRCKTMAVAFIARAEIAGLVYVEWAGRVEMVAGERVFEREADANEEGRAWNRFLDAMPKKPPSVTGPPYESPLVLNLKVHAC